MAPPDVGPGHDHRPLRRGQQRHRPVEQIGVRARRKGGPAQRTRFAAIGGLAEHVVHREVDERHSGGCTDRGPQGVVDTVADRRGGLRRGRVTGQRRDEGHVVDFLQ